ncbi:MAG TPA: prolyl oligopeptidase family serine peptidase, partial [Herpetosiphonaceae bacterium]|nr:prolyl oligopeptidase family serine peptidase [Herpetosiphonaceae bacterium]
AAPWKQRFRALAVLWTQLAREAPGRGMAVSNQTGVYQLYAWDVASGDLRQITNRAEGMLSGMIAPDGRYIYYHDDQGGNEIGHFVRVPFEGGAPEDVAPDLPPYSAWSIGASRSGNMIGFIQASDDGFHLHLIDMGNDGKIGAHRELYHTRSLAFGPSFSYAGEIALVASSERAGKPQFSLLAIDTSSGERIAELWDGPDTSVESVSFAPIRNDGRVLATTNRSGLKRPLIWIPRTGERIDLQFPELAGEVEPWQWSDDARRLLLCQTNAAVQQLYVYDLVSRNLVRLNHPEGSFWAAHFVSDSEIWITWNDAAHPPQTIALDAATGERTRTILAAGDVPPGRPWRSVTFTSSDGQTIQAWLAVPEGDGPFPTIIDTHGGPSAVSTPGFSPESQTWLDHGFAWMTINYRGSTTFGREFEEKIWGDLGHWEIEDMVAGRDWLIEQDIADPDSILLTGWSYGGYLTLMGLGKRPDLWAGGMAGVAIADWSIQYEDTADTLKAYQVAILGGTPQEQPEHYAAASPITYAENVAAPVLVIQGRNDTRTPARPIEMYEQKLKQLGKQIDVHWFDAGHAGGFAQTEQAILHHELMLRFAYRVLG